MTNLGFHENKSLGGVRKSMTPANGKNITEYDEKIQNNRLPVGFRISFQETFL